MVIQLRDDAGSREVAACGGGKTWLGSRFLLRMKLKGLLADWIGTV